MYGLGGVFINNFTEIAGMAFVALMAYWFGRFIQRTWPHAHLRPWLWFSRRS